MSRSLYSLTAAVLSAGIVLIGSGCTRDDTQPYHSGPIGVDDPVYNENTNQSAGEIPESEEPGSDAGQAPENEPEETF